MIGLALVCSVAAALIVWWVWPSNPPASVAPSTPLPPAPQAKDQPQETIKVKTVIVYRDRPVPLPSAKPTERVTATGRLEAEARPYTLSATLDTETGQSRVWAQPEPLPWVGLSHLGAAGVHVGVKDGAQVARLSIRQDVIRSKQVFGGVAASIDSDGQWFAGIGGEYRW
jgi:hypothetical protein